MILTPWFWLKWPVIITTTFVSCFSISGSYENTGWTEQLSLPKKKPWTRFQTLPTAPGGPIIGTSYSSLPPFPFSLFVLLLSFYSLLSSSPLLLFFFSLIITPSLFSSLPFYSILFSSPPLLFFSYLIITPSLFYPSTLLLFSSLIITHLLLSSLLFPPLLFSSLLPSVSGYFLVDGRTKGEPC